MREYKETQHSLQYKSNSDLTFYSAGYEACSPGYSYGPKFRSYQLIHFVLEGSGKLHINEHVFQLSAGDAFLIPSGKISFMKRQRKIHGITPGSAFWGSVRKRTCTRS